MIVKRNKANVFKTSGVTFLPGNNILTDEQYEAVKDSESFQSQLKNVLVDTKLPVMEIVKTEKKSIIKSPLPKIDKKDDDTDMVKDILEVSIKDATVLIDEIFSIPTLEKILEVDSRVGIRKAVETQIEKLRTEDKDETEEED